MTARGANTGGPICILGLPRSGTTWVGKIFDSHPETLYRHEPDSGGALDHISITATPHSTGTLTDHMRTFLHSLPRQRSLKVCAKRPIFAKDYLPGWRDAVRRGSIHAARLASVLTALPVLEPVDPRCAEPRVVWKSIESTGRAGLIAGSDPSARVILVVRHPCGQIDSMLYGEAGRRFTDAYTAADDWGIFEYLLATDQAKRRGLTMEQLREACPEERLAWRWLLFNEKAIQELRGQPNSYIVRYEDICEKPRLLARTMFQFAGLNWSDSVEAFVQETTTPAEYADYSVYRDPERAAWGWRDRLEPAVAERICTLMDGSTPGKLYAEDTVRKRGSVDA